MVFISKQNKFLFIHIPKTGGKTIRKTLNKRLKNDFNVHCNTVEHLFSKRCLDYQNRMINPLHYSYYDVHDMVDDSYYTCVFIRNPYDRFYSLYLHFKQEMKEYISIVVAFNVVLVGFSVLLYKRRPNIAKWVIFVIVLINIFVVYRTMYPEIIHELFANDFSTFMTRNLTYLYHSYYNFMKPQYLYVIPEKTQFIGREENFSRDFKKILKRLNIKSNIYSTNVKNIRKKRSVVNGHVKYKYQEKFTPETIKLVNKIYKKDFEIFNYEMLDPQSGSKTV